MNMQNSDRDDGFVFKISSVLFASFIWPSIISLFGRHWNEKMILPLAGSVVLVASGWIFLIFGSRIAGFVHFAFMILLAGFWLWHGVNGLQTPLADNPAAGVIAIASLVYLAVGAVTAILAAGIGFFLFKQS